MAVEGCSFKSKQKSLLVYLAVLPEGPRKKMLKIMEARTFKNVNIFLNSNIYSYLETSGGQSSNLYLNVVHFLTPELLRHLWQLKTVVFLHQCLMLAVLLINYPDKYFF
jgi:hypothetical protein